MVQELGDWPWDADFGIIGINYNIIGEYEQLRNTALWNTNI